MAGQNISKEIRELNPKIRQPKRWPCLLMWKNLMAMEFWSRTEPISTLTGGNGSLQPEMSLLNSCLISGNGFQRTGSLLQRILQRDRKSTRLNSSHVAISYAVVFLK